MKKVKRLYNEFQPEHYDINLALDRDSMVFSGKVTIRGRRVGKPSRRITLHQKGLKVTAAKITKQDKKRGELNIEVERINRHGNFDEVRLHVNEMIYPGDYELQIDFNGRLTDQMHGIYPCYFNHDGQKKSLIATQFESHHAREAFPCIDEPEAKATFDLSLLTPAGETVIANTPIKSQSKKDGQLFTIFETTPKMSTYLLAFAYGEMIYREGRTKNGTAVRSYGTPLTAGLLDYSVDSGIASVEFFEDYFGVPYPLPKLDMLALPDFSSGAMENWGLITFRESVMLVDPKHTAIETKQVASLVIAHEIAHQWFGNLVTMKWWDDLWLNESFANLMEYRAVDTIEPSWNIFEQFVNSEMNMAMRRDALPNVQPVRTEVRHPDEIGSLFDPAIVYAKGGNILRMLMNYIGEDDFRRGLSAYFKQHAYGNTTADDLWAALSAVTGKDVAAFMDNWLNRPGYPVVSIEHTPGDRTAALAQKRLVIGADIGNIAWPVPLSAKPELSSRVLEAAEQTLELPDPNEPLLLNHDGGSYFIPHYKNKRHTAAIVEALDQGKIDSTDRLLLLMHGSIMESAGLVSTVDNLRFAGALRAEQEESVWSSVAGIIASARRLVAKDEPAEENLNKFIRDLVSGVVERVGWQARGSSDTAQIKRLRNLALGLAAGAKLPEVLDKGRQAFADFKQPFDLAPDVRGTIYFIGARFGTDADFEKLLNLYRSIDNADEKDEISSALISTRQPQHIETLIGLLTSEHVRAQDLPRWFAWLMRNQYATDSTWRWLGTHWDWIEEKYGDDKSFDAFPRYAAMAFSTPGELKKYQQFFTPLRSEAALTRVIDLGVEEISGRIAWRRKNEAAVKKFLAGN